jgi:hypothetical protein
MNPLNQGFMCDFPKDAPICLSDSLAEIVEECQTNNKAFLAELVRCFILISGRPTDNKHFRTHWREVPTMKQLDEREQRLVEECENPLQEPPMLQIRYGTAGESFHTASQIENPLKAQEGWYETDPWWGFEVYETTVIKQEWIANHGNPDHPAFQALYDAVKNQIRFKKRSANNCNLKPKHLCFNTTPAADFPYSGITTYKSTRKTIETFWLAKQQGVMNLQVYPFANDPNLYITKLWLEKICHMGQIAIAYEWNIWMQN